jgi:HAD superfamily hydrolase (TIGR01509 family)
MRDNGSVRLLLLDCDGVLVRSESANLAYYNHIFRAFDLPAVAPEDRNAVARLHTLSTPQVIESFFPAAAQAAASDYATTVDYRLFLGELEVEPGWAEVLRRWRRHGAAAVATNRGASARAVLETVGLLDLVDLVVTIRDVARPKPHPDLLLKALAHFDADPQEALYVGDSPLDRDAAGRAGVRFLGFRTPVPPAARDPAEVEAYLCALAGGNPSVTLPAASS